MAIFSFMTLGLSCQDKSSFKSVDVREFKEVIKDTSVILVDVRTSEEFHEGHIAGTDFNIDVLKGDFSAKAAELLPEGSSLAIYCRSGNRSKTAAEKLVKAGYKVTELSTGYRGWAGAGEEIIKQ